ncbi:MAG: phage integrase N-terminal SAM-like domain-containing protein [Deltaproteobacteria bacterium]|nr:phage integrase N-terminal SAM-like domain-containing protein [Deltaproteobacteria bacterium]
MAAGVATPTFPHRPQVQMVPAQASGAFIHPSTLPKDPTAQPKPKLLDRVREAIRLRHYSLRTEDTYLHWIKRFIFFHGKRHPAEMGAAEITRFLSALAIDRHVSTSTQNQALNALLFLYRHVLALEVEWLDNVVRAKQP